MIELPIPQEVKNDSRALEILRIWQAGGVEHLSLRVDQWPDPAYWGLMLADVLRHLSKAYELVGMSTAAETQLRILEGFQAEVASPTEDRTQGRLEV